MQFPTERVKTRLLREACRTVADERGTGLLDVEERYSMVRTSLVHLHHHAPGTGILEVKRKLSELLPETRRYLAEITAELPRDRVKKIALATQRLSEAAALFFKTQDISAEDLHMFLRVLEVYREKCLAAQYNPSDIIPTELFLLGMLIDSDFDSYSEALNGAA